MKKIYNLSVFIAISTLCSIALLVCLFVYVRPVVQEEYIAYQTVALSGKIYICGTYNDNKDTESLYCNGFNDGAKMMLQKIEMNAQITKSENRDLLRFNAREGSTMTNSEIKNQCEMFGGIVSGPSWSNPDDIAGTSINVCYIDGEYIEIK